MPPSLKALLALCLLCLAPTLLASGKKDSKASVSFHMETDASDNPKMTFTQEIGGRMRHFRRMPEVLTKDIASFSPFPAESGQDYGITFQLKGHAATRLAAITNANQGRWMVSQVNGRVVDAVLIDSEIRDGLLIIWKHVTLADIDILDDSMPRTGEQEKKK